MRNYLCIDLKSFYASVECVERGLDPLTTKLVVADPERTDKTICLAVSPSLKAMGVRNRCRVFEIPQNIDYIMAVPRMQLYLDYAANIYQVYLKYIAKEDIHVYSIDEAFMDVTDYLDLYQMTPKELGIRMMEDVYETTGITATCGIGTNLYLTKIALDITAKHVPDHIGILDEETYQKTLWNHKPITDFWRVGPGTARRLARYGIETMGQLAHAEEEMLYKAFGIDAELLIDHAWGREPVTMADIKAYKPSTNCLSSGQVLACDYTKEKGRLIVKEMTDLLCLDLVDKDLVTDSVTLTVGYANRLHMDSSHGSFRLEDATSSARIILEKMTELYDRIVDPVAPVHRLGITFCNVHEESYHQLGLFDNSQEREREKKMQQAMLEIKGRFGKNAILKGMNLEEGATTRERNQQIGGHRS